MEPKAEWAIDSEAMRARGIIVLVDLYLYLYLYLLASPGFLARMPQQREPLGLLQLGSRDQIFPREFLYFGL